MKTKEDVREMYAQKVEKKGFAKTIGLFGATTIGVGALMGGGIYVLIGIAAGIAGPGVIFAYVLCGMLAFLTTLMYAELAKKSPVSGGGYTYAFHNVGPIGGFTTGWFLALGSLFACGMYALGFAEYFTSVLNIRSDFNVIVSAIGISVVSTVLNIYASKEANKMQSFLTWGNLIILAALVAVGLFFVDFDNFSPTFPKGIQSVGSAISVIYISFFGYQLIANNTDEIIDSKKTVGKAMKLSMIISFVAYIAVSLIALLVIPWNVLADSTAPLVLVAQKGFGNVGSIVISFGGILASASALNSTVFSTSRQIMAMGQDRFFPDAMGRINEKTETPREALLGGIVVIVIILLFFKLDFVAKSANFCLLASLIPVSFALRKVYNNNASLRPHVWFFRFLPEIALIANVFLLFTLDLVSLAFGQQLALIGAAVFFFYSRKRVTRGQEGMNIDLSDHKTSLISFGKKILVPMANPKNQEKLMRFAKILLGNSRFNVIVSLNIVKTKEDVSFYDTLQNTETPVDMVSNVVRLSKQEHVTVHPIVRASQSIGKGIAFTAEDENCNYILLGYDSDKSVPIIEEVFKFSSAETILLKTKNIKDDFNFKNILVYIKGWHHLNTILYVLSQITTYEEHHITLMYVLSPKFSDKERKKADRILSNILPRIPTNCTYDIKFVRTANPLDEILLVSNDYDLLVIAARKDSLVGHHPFGERNARIMNETTVPVVMVREVSKIKRMIHRI